MSAKGKVGVAFAIAAVLVPLVMSFFLGWWTVLWAPLALIVLGLATVATGVFTEPDPRAGVSYIDSSGLDEVPLPEPDPVYRHATGEIRLPSAQSDYAFVFSATVCRRERRPSAVVGEHRNPEALADELVLDRAAKIAAGLSPELYGAARPRLAAVLGEVVPDGRNRFEVWAEDVSLTLPKEDAQRLRSLADIRKDKDVWEHQRAHERDQREYYGNDVLSSQASAVSWWFSRDPSKVRETVELTDTLGELSAAADSSEALAEFRALVPRAGAPGATQVPLWEDGGSTAEAPVGTPAAPSAWEPVDHAGALIDLSVERGGPGLRDSMPDRLALVLDQHEQSDTAAELRKKYDAPQLFDPYAEGAGTPEGLTDVPMDEQEGGDEEGRADPPREGDDGFPDDKPPF
ncbi:hypothetical protein ACFOVU_04775 [Nocardiopsis sediminis]|uniref:Integral membrane protein n=1 Tax=Nocardiopsis sediminis TaxID=1778267 RepID=A0ABV8FGL5_9ACTN